MRRSWSLSFPNMGRMFTHQFAQFNAPTVIQGSFDWWFLWAMALICRVRPAHSQKPRMCDIGLSHPSPTLRAGSNQKKVGEHPHPAPDTRRGVCYASETVSWDIGPGSLDTFQ